MGGGIGTRPSPLIVPNNKHSHRSPACDHDVGRSGPAEAWMFFDVRETKIRDDLRSAIYSVGREGSSGRLEGCQGP